MKCQMNMKFERMLKGWVHLNGRNVGRNGKQMSLRWHEQKKRERAKNVHKQQIIAQRRISEKIMATSIPLRTFKLHSDTFKLYMHFSFGPKILDYLLSITFHTVSVTRYYHFIRTFQCWCTSSTFNTIHLLSKVLYLHRQVSKQILSQFVSSTHFHNKLEWK